VECILKVALLLPERRLGQAGPRRLIPPFPQKMIDFESRHKVQCSALLLVLG